MHRVRLAALRKRRVAIRNVEAEAVHGTGVGAHMGRDDLEDAALGQLDKMDAEWAGTKQVERLVPNIADEPLPQLGLAERVVPLDAQIHWAVVLPPHPAHAKPPTIKTTTQDRMSRNDRAERPVEKIVIKPSIKSIISPLLQQTSVDRQ